MKALFKKSLALLLSAMLLFTAVPYAASAAKIAEQSVGASSGMTGNCTWTLDDEGTLTISGNGRMDSYEYNNPAPWGKSIKSLIIENGVTSIEDWAFEGCTGLTSVTIPSSVTSIGNTAFSSCAGLTSITIPNSVTSIERSAFDCCTGLTSVTIGNSVTYIGFAAFRSCTGLKSITIPNSVTTIKSFAFINTAWYNSQPDGLVYAGKIAYDYKGTMPDNTSIVLKEGTKGIADDAFEGCTGLTSITIPDSVTSIGDSAFVRCTSLTSVTIPSSVTSIGTYAFYSCAELTSITIPDSVTEINSFSFDNCNILKDVYYSGSESQWEGLEIQSGNECLFEATIHYYHQYSAQGFSAPIPAENSSDIIVGNCGEGDVWSGDFGHNNGSKYSDNVQWRLNKATGLLEIFGTGEMGSFWVLEIYQPWKPYQSIIKDVIVYEGVSKIGDGAFAFCGNIQTIYLPSTLTSVGLYSFYGNNSLNTIYYGGRKNDYVGPNGNVKYNSRKRFWDFSESSLYCDSAKILGLEITFKAQWFFHDSATYDHNIARFCSLIDMAGYQTTSDLKAVLGPLGFKIDDEYLNLDTGRDEVNYFIATKDINENGKIYNLIILGCIGSHNYQWNSDFDPEGKDSTTSYPNSDSLKGDNHRGFNDAKHFVLERLNTYYSNNHFNKLNTKFIVTGHSRGAATANLISAELIDGNDYVLPQNLFTYTFATPNNTTNPNRSSGIYCRVFNIVNPTDFVTKAMPSAWGWGRYGTTYSLPTKTNDKNYSALKNKMMGYYRVLNKATKGNETYCDYLGGEKEVYNVVKTLTSSVHNVDEFYNKKLIYCGKITDPMTHLSVPNRLSTFEYFDKGLCQIANEKGNHPLGYSVLLTPLSSDSFLFKALSLFFVANQGVSKNFEDAHKMETYCAYIMGLNAGDMYKREGLFGTVNCPVDVEIYDNKTNELVGQITNNIVNEEIAAKENSVVMYVNGDEKFFCLPSNGNYDVHFIGNDTGTMDYSVTTVDSDLGEISRQNYDSIALEQNKTYTQSFEIEPTNIESNKLKDEYGNAIEANESFIATEKQTYAVTINTEGSGVANDSMVVISGDYVTLSAETVGSYFLGWYNGDYVLSQDIQYHFRPNEDIEITAKFSGLIGDANSDCYLNINDVTAIQRHIAELELLTEEGLALADTNGDGEINISDATHLQMYLAEYDVVLGKQS